jgi:hypothetical protein
MSISSLLGPTASPPLKPPDPSPPKPPEVKADDASAPQPVVLAALPPGQGTRVNQLV